MITETWRHRSWYQGSDRSALCCLLALYLPPPMFRQCPPPTIGQTEGRGPWMLLRHRAGRRRESGGRAGRHLAQGSKGKRKYLSEEFPLKGAHRLPGTVPGHLETVIPVIHLWRELMLLFSRPVWGN